MSTEDDTLDQRELALLVNMRKTLSAVIRDTTPPAGMQHPLTSGTIDEIRKCLGAITEREREIRQRDGTDPGLRPRFIDEPRTSQVVPFTKPDKGDSEK